VILKLSILYDQYFLQLQDAAIAAIEDDNPGLVVAFSGQNGSVSVADMIDSEIVYGKPPPEMLKDLVNLKWLHLPSAGADPYTDASLYAGNSVILTKSSGTFGIPIAEHVLGMMIALSRNFILHHENQLVGEWHQDWHDSFEIFGSNVLVLGLGNIGTEVCKRLSGFGCNVTGFRNDPSVPHGLVSDVLPISRLAESLPDADYVIVCLPGTEGTKGLIGREEFAVMKKRAIVINIGRGFVIDTDALVAALNGSQIAGAGLDVTDPEPLPPGHPLWSARNVLITPHVSAFTPGITVRRHEIFLDLLKRYLSGKPLFNKVDIALGY